MVDGVFRHLPYFSYIYANTRLICAHVSLGDRSVEDKRDTHRHRGQGGAAARFQLVWRLIWASKPRAVGLLDLSLKNLKEDLEAAYDIIESLRRGEVTS